MCNIVLAQWQTLNEQIIMKMMMHPFLPFWLLLHRVPTKSCEQNFEGFSEPPVTFGGLWKDPVTRYIVWSFLTKTISRIKCPQVVSMPKFGPTAPDFGYDLWAQNSVSNSLCIQIIHFLNNVLGIWRVWFSLIYQKMFQISKLYHSFLTKWIYNILIIHTYCFPRKCEARFCVKFSSVCGDKFHYWEELSHRFNKIAHLLCPGNLQCALIILKRYPTRWDSQMHIQFIQQLGLLLPI